MKNSLALFFILLFIPAIALSQDVNSPAPDFSANDLNGNPVKLSDLKGKVVLIDFWASWCVPCKKSMPHLIDLYNTYKDTSFAIIGVNVDTDLGKLQEFERAIGMDIPFPVIFDSGSKIPPLYSVDGMPTTVLVNKQGVIKYKEVGYDNDLKNKLDKTISELISK